MTTNRDLMMQVRWADDHRPLRGSWAGLLGLMVGSATLVGALAYLMFG